MKGHSKLTTLCPASERKLAHSVCVCLCRVTEQLPPFYREIQSEEMWFYKFHRVEVDHVPTALMFVSTCSNKYQCILPSIYQHWDTCMKLFYRLWNWSRVLQQVYCVEKEANPQWVFLCWFNANVKESLNIVHFKSGSICFMSDFPKSSLLVWCHLIKLR